MDTNIIKNTIKDLVDESNSIIEECNTDNTSSKFIHPFFESLGWDLNTDVTSENFDVIEPQQDKDGKPTGEKTTQTINAFQIDNVTRFYLKKFPLNSSLELFKDEILSCVEYGFNRGITWVIVTNFKETKVYNTESTGRTLAAMQYRFFLASEYIEKFQKLSDLTKKQFSLNVLDDNAEYFGEKPKRISIDKQLLEDLLHYRNILVNDIVKENSISENDVQFAAQKILNRLIFIRSCGDRTIENRYLKSAIHEWGKNKNKKLIYHLQEIFSYFRGKYGSTLFEKHRCDELIISDNVLQQVIEGTYQSKKKAVRYNFAHIEHDSLGKMYENYLGTVQQKKDGAYYTPSYISKYICQNTIIPYLSKSNATEISDLITEYSDNLEELESKVQNIKILDPACGTGEFLIRAIDVLLEISTEIQAQKEIKGQYQTSDSTSRKAPRSLKKKKSDQTTFQTFDKDIENQQLRTIIQNNIHGVDINEQAIEITQLNLFLKLATSSQQLIDLSKNILIGNSLIDDPNIDPLLAFDWNKKFPGKFDVVIGNPPYIAWKEIDRNQRKFFEDGKYLDIEYSCRPNHKDGQPNYYLLFFPRLANLLSKNQIASIIIPQEWLEHNRAKDFRNYLLEKFNEIKIVQFNSDFKVFKNNKQTIGTSSLIITLYKSGNKKISWNYIDHKNEKLVTECLVNNQFTTTIIKDFDELKNNSWRFSTVGEDIFKKRIESLKNIFYLHDENQFSVKGGFQPPIDDTQKFEITSSQYSKLTKEEQEYVFPLIFNAKEIKPYVFSQSELKFWIVCNEIDSEKQLRIDFPNLFKILTNTCSQDSEKWWNFPNIRNFSLIKKSGKKLIAPRTAAHVSFAFDESKSVFKGTNTMVVSKNIPTLYLLGILNSKLSNYWYSNYGTKYHGSYFKFEPKLVKENCLPILFVKEKESDITNLVKKIISHKKESKPPDDYIEQLDDLIFEIYGLTSEEIKIIKNA